MGASGGTGQVGGRSLRDCPAPTLFHSLMARHLARNLASCAFLWGSAR